MKKIKILKPVAGVYGLSDNIGDIITIDKKSASEMIASGHAEEVKTKKPASPTGGHKTKNYKR